MRALSVFLLCLMGIGLVACSTSGGTPTSAVNQPRNANQSSSAQAARNSFPVIHVFVALCDNVNQGIVPVSASLGNGDSPATNLYWGAAFGVKTFFSRNKDWQLISVTPNPGEGILERCIFKHRRGKKS